MRAKIWLAGWLIIIITTLSVLGFGVYQVDPYFHYHKPDTDKYFYTIDNQRSQNDGISKHFDYDAMITGTSMTESFRTSEADDMFGLHFIKTCYAGASYKEINDNIKSALVANPNLKTIIRCLDMNKFTSPWDQMRFDLGTYPDYLYNNNPFDDVEYLLNRDVALDRVYQMKKESKSDSPQVGITSFDDYSRWQESYKFGINELSYNAEICSISDNGTSHLTDDEKAIIEKNITLNVTDVTDMYPDVTFNYYYSPYSIGWWYKCYTDNTLIKQLETEAYVTELLVAHPNIHLYSFNTRSDIITDLNNYRDDIHYASWINSLILKCISTEQYLITADNFRDYLQEEHDFLTTFDFTSINGQEDYEADNYAAALLNGELTEITPLDVLSDNDLDIEIKGSEIIHETDNTSSLLCQGALLRDSTDDMSDYVRDQEYIGIKFTVDLGQGYEGYNYLCFNGQKISESGQPLIYVYDENGNDVLKFEASYSELDNELHQYAIDLSTLRGKYTIAMNGGAPDNTQSKDSCYRFSDIILY